MIIYQHPSKHFSKNELFTLIRHSGKTGLHWHRAIEFLFFLDGELELSLNGKKQVVGKGDLVIVNSSVVHASRKLVEPLDYYILIVNDEFFRNNKLYSDSTSFAPVIRSEQAKEIFLNIVREYESTEELSNAAILSYLISLFVLLNRKYKTEDEGAPYSETKKLSVVRSTLSYLQENYKERLTVDGIAGALHFSRSYLSHVFKEITGYSLMNYVNLLRCQNAKTMILDGSGIAEAAMDSGFSELSYFTRVFKKTIGTLPSLVREQVYSVGTGKTHKNNFSEQKT